jgi:hypothetical protein
VDGGDKFDLNAWDEAYFERLQAFCKQASSRGIVVEFVLFCPFYEEDLWAINPMNSANNVNKMHEIKREEVYTLKHPDLLRIQQAFVAKVVEALRDVDNVYFEICNEPYFGGVTLEWQAKIAEQIEKTEAGLAPQRRHMIAQNIANGRARIENPNPAVSLFNFHYAYPPDVIRLNAGLKRAIGDDETGFRGTSNRPYRAEAWHFLLSGGSVFSHLDYSFTTDHEAGDAPVSDPTPGGGGAEFRNQLSLLKQFLNSFDLLQLAPNHDLVGGGVPDGGLASALSQGHSAHAVYLSVGGEAPTRAQLSVQLPAGHYRIEWVDPRKAQAHMPIMLDHKDGLATLETPTFSEDIAVKIHAVHP